MDWSKGYSSIYYATTVDSKSFRDIDRFEITSGSISKSDSGLLVSADITCLNYDQSSERYVRIYLDARQNGDSEHIALFTGLAVSPDRDINGNRVENNVQCYSVLKPAQDVLLPRGWYAPSDTNGALIIKNLLSVISAPIEIEDNSPLLSQAVIAEDGDSRLDMAEKILQAIDWRMKIDGDGTVRVIPKSNGIVTTFSAQDNDSIEPQLTVEYDWYESPNVFRAVIDDLSAIARDDSIDSPLSTVNRGREVWMEETSCDLADNESIAAYAMRRLKEEQYTAYKVSYDRRFFPNIEVGDLIRLHYPSQDIDGTFKVESQSIELSHGARTSEEVVKV